MAKTPGRKVDHSSEKSLPKKPTKQLGKEKQRGKLTRQGHKDVPNDNPNGKEDFDRLLEEFVKPKGK